MDVANDWKRRLNARSYYGMAMQHLLKPPSSRVQALALALFQKSLELDPTNILTYLGMAWAHYWLGRPDEALAWCDKALAREPDSVAARTYRCSLQLPLLQRYAEDGPSGRQKYRAALLELHEFFATRDDEELAEAAEIAAMPPLALGYQGYGERELQELKAQLTSRLMAARYPEWTAAPEVGPLQPGERIRVGFVSIGFNSNPDWYMISKGWLARLDRSRFELFVYAIGEVHDAETDFARDHCDHFQEGNHPRTEWAERIRADRLHVLIHQNAGLMPGYDLAALRLAAVQCAAWGNPITTGLPTMDYYLSGDAAEPPEGATHYSERLVRLPNLSSYYTPRPIAPAPVTRADFGLRPDATVYLCVQLLVKYLPTHDYFFPRIAREVPNAQFVFIRNLSDPVFRQFEERLERAFAAYGLRKADHVVSLDSMPLPKYQGLCELSDVYLDSVFFGGCVSTMDTAVAHAIPVVTLPGEFLRGRQGRAILTLMGVTETIAASAEEYIAIAVRLGNDAAYRQEIAAEMAANRHKVYEDDECIAGLEAFLQRAAHEATGAAQLAASRA